MGPLLELPRPLPPLDSLELPPLTLTGQHTRVLEVPMRPLFTLRRLPLIPNLRPTIRMLRTASSMPERIETLPLPLLPRTPKSKESTTRERELTEDSSRPSLHEKLA